MLIEELQRQAGLTVEGVYRLSETRTRTDRFGRPYGYALLEDRTGALPAYIWRARATDVPSLTLHCSVRATLALRQFQGRLIGDVLCLTREGVSGFNPIQLLPHRELENASGAARLQEFIDGLEPSALRQFLQAVFGNTSLALAYLHAPASQAHHHAYPGGLLDHSLEVADIVHGTLVQEEPAINALAVVAGLLHDLGKVRILAPNGSRTRAGYLLNHEALTLELLAPSLAQLDRTWPDGAIALRYLLTWQAGGRETRPLLPAALALQFADRYSSAADTRDQAFAGKPDWQRFARLEAAGPVSRFWRPTATPVIGLCPGRT